jgi:arginine/ornithine N-succinyltransferase beta subunit
VQAAHEADEVLVTADEVGTTALTLEEAAAEETALALEVATTAEEGLTGAGGVTTALADETAEEVVGLLAAAVEVGVLQPHPKPKMQKVRLSRA